MDRGNLPTERAHPASTDLDLLPTRDAVALFARIDREALAAVEAAGDAIARAVDLTTERLQRGGRLFYVGAGTSGRLGALDAAECPPTFQSAPEQVQAIIAGGPVALTRAVEGAEDSVAEAQAALREHHIGQGDVVFGITAGGTTPFVLSALAAAREVGAGTILLACVSEADAPAEVDVSLRLMTGPEILTGSTRLKAGTATKLALNTLSTLVMTRLGKVHGNLMVDVDTHTNSKLVDRGTRLVATLTGLPRAESHALLERAGGRVKIATLMHRFECEASAAEQRLQRAGGYLRRAMAEPE